MKQIGKLLINPEKVLTKEDLMNFKGGDAPACESPRQRYRCYCYNSIGMWEGCYISLAEANAQGEEWCASGIAECFLI